MVLLLCSCTSSSKILEIFLPWCSWFYSAVPDQAGENPVLAPGEYSFPFQFHTPGQNLPTSVEGKYGHVRYWLKASIDRPWRFDITSKSVFTIIEYVDINRDQELLVRIYIDEMCFFISYITTTLTNRLMMLSRHCWLDTFLKLKSCCVQREA